MKSVKLINKETKKVYISKDGVELRGNTLEVGDIFIPIYNSYKLELKKNVETSTGKKTIKEYTLLAKAKSKDGEVYKVNGSEEIWFKITETQAKSLQKKIDKGEFINRIPFRVSNYESEEWGTQVGFYELTKKVETIGWDEVDEMLESTSEE